MPDGKGCSVRGRRARVVGRRRRGLWSLAACILLVLGAVATGLVTGVSGGSSAAAAAPGSTSSVTGIHVVHPAGGTPYLANGAGRFVLLRGVDDNALVRYPADYREAPSIGRGDLKEMAALGFNFLRLAVSWSEIMPEPGHLDQGYLRRVAQVVNWAAASGIGVLVDMHEDNYSTVTDEGQEADGTPAWAVVDHGTPCTPAATTTACALAAFQSFWSDVDVVGKPLQTWYLEATAAVARAAGANRARSNVVGVELMNEPWPTGSSFEQTSLYPFYNRMIGGLRADGVVAPLWFEPSILRDLTDDALPQAAKFSTDGDLVYAVHIYAGVFAPPDGPTRSLGAMATSYANAAKEAAVFATPFMVDEYGSNATPEWNTWLAAQLDQQDEHTVGSGFWLWKQRTGRWDDWAVVHLDGSLRSGTLRAQLLSEPHVDAVPGDLVATAASAARLTATVEGSGGTARLWGGTVVRAGGRSTTVHTLRRVTVDGHLASAGCQVVRWQGGGTDLYGCVLSVHLPAGRTSIVATP